MLSRLYGVLLPFFVAILLSLSFWGALMGVIGMIIALPLTTLGISCYKHYVLHEPFMSEQKTEAT